MSYCTLIAKQLPFVRFTHIIRRYVGGGPIGTSLGRDFMHRLQHYKLGGRHGNCATPVSLMEAFKFKF